MVLRQNIWTVNGTIYIIKKNPEARLIGWHRAARGVLQLMVWTLSWLKDVKGALTLQELPIVIP